MWPSYQEHVFVSRESSLKRTVGNGSAFFLGHVTSLVYRYSSNVQNGKVVHSNIIVAMSHQLTQNGQQAEIHSTPFP